MSLTGWREGAAVTAVAAVLAILMTWPLALHAGSAGRLDTGDGEFSIWVVSWVARTSVADPARLYDANIFHPRRGTLAYSETFLVAGLLAVPGYWLTANPVFAHNSALLLGLVLSFIATYYLVRYLTRNRQAAFVSAVLFAFCPQVFARTAHIHLMMTAGLPLTLLAFHRLVDRPGPWRAAALGGALWFVAMSSGYYGIFAGLLCAGGTLFYLVSRSCWREWRYYVWIGAAALLGIGLVLPFFIPFLRLAGEAGPLRTLREAVQWSADWRSYLASGGLGHRWMLPLIQSWREVLFPGFVAVGLGLAGAVAGFAAGLRPRRGAKLLASPGRRRPLAGPPPLLETTLFYTLIAVVSAWVSFGPAGGLYSLLYRAIPVFTFLRAPARMGLLVTLALAVLAGIALMRLLEDRRRAWPIAAGIAALALLELTPAPLRFPAARPRSHVYRVLSTLPRGGLAEFPFFSHRVQRHRHAYYMFNSTWHWQPLLNGYSDYIPPDFTAMLPEINSFPSPEAYALLRRYDARYVTVHKNFYHHLALPDILDRLKHDRPHLRPLAEDANTLLYEIVSWPD
ncbi:MAG TPA: hypothetical protein VK911_10825 [Vicinamibacterales bacterium]|nr:hypothetical protein [Vicinamibacterales bacterium]